MQTDLLEPAPDGTAIAGGPKLLKYYALACALTWLCATPTALAWSRHEAPSPLAIAGAGLSAFGPLFAMLAVTTRAERRGIFGRLRTSPPWLLLSLAAPAAIHLVAIALFEMFGGHPDSWFHPPAHPEALAALVVFPLGEEFGWRGFAYPRMVRRFGVVGGSLLLGVLWGGWHLAYSVTPEHAGFDLSEFMFGMLELPLYSVLMAWVLERTGRSVSVAIAFHAGGHLDHIEHAHVAGPLLPACHIGIVAVLAALAAWSLARREAAASCAPS